MVLTILRSSIPTIKLPLESSSKVYLENGLIFTGKWVKNMWSVTSNSGLTWQICVNTNKLPSMYVSVKNVGINNGVTESITIALSDFRKESSSRGIFRRISCRSPVSSSSSQHLIILMRDKTAEKDFFVGLVKVREIHLNKSKVLS